MTTSKRKIDILEEDVRRLKVLRDNLPMEDWGCVEHQLSQKLAEISSLRKNAGQRECSKRKLLKAIIIWGYLTDAADELADIIGGQFVDEEIEPIVDDFIERLSGTKFFDRI